MHARGRWNCRALRILPSRKHLTVGADRKEWLVHRFRHQSEADEFEFCGLTVELRNVGDISEMDQSAAGDDYHRRAPDWHGGERRRVVLHLAVLGASGVSA